MICVNTQGQEEGSDWWSTKSFQNALNIRCWRYDMTHSLTTGNGFLFLNQTQEQISEISFVFRLWGWCPSTCPVPCFKHSNQTPTCLYYTATMWQDSVLQNLTFSWLPGLLFIMCPSLDPHTPRLTPLFSQLAPHPKNDQIYTFQMPKTVNDILKKLNKGENFL